MDKPPDLSDPQMVCLARLLVSAEIGLRTNNGAFTKDYHNAWRKENSIYERRLAKEWLATNKPSLKVPNFSGVQADLDAFVAEVERLCNAPKGTAVVTDTSGVYLPWPQEPAYEANCLYTVLKASNLNENGIEVEWGGVP